MRISLLEVSSAEHCQHDKIPRDIERASEKRFRFWTDGVFDVELVFDANCKVLPHEEVTCSAVDFPRSSFFYMPLQHKQMMMGYKDQCVQSSFPTVVIGVMANSRDRLSTSDYSLLLLIEEVPQGKAALGLSRR